MRIMWLSPVVIPQIANITDIPIPQSGGWIEGLISEILKRDDVKCFFCFDTSTGQEISGEVNNVQYYGFSEKKITTEKFLYYISLFQPDLIHIFGTEKAFTLSMVLACERAGLLGKTIISIQGLTSIIAKHYYAFLPNSIIHGWSFRDIVKRSNLACEKRLFEKRGLKEIHALKLVKHVIGRTEWDYACVRRINSSAIYHKCNESLRPVFYNKEWEIGNCQRHSIFVSQYSYPLKGFHLMIEAMEDIVLDYPDASLYVTGNDPVNCSFRDSISQSNYVKYLVKLIKEKRLEKNICFCGKLNATQMLNRYLKANVFVCCSSIENSSNSIGEAMLLGVPVIASDVGGVKSLLTHGKEGLLYQADAPYMLARSICSVFEKDSLAIELSNNEKKRARITHDIISNSNTLYGIYHEIMECY